MLKLSLVMIKDFLIRLGNVYTDVGLPDTRTPAFTKNTKNLVFVIATILTLYFLVSAGYKYITSGGNPEKTKEAGQTIVYACVGLFLILMAYSLVTWVFKIGASGV